MITSWVLGREFTQVMSVEKELIISFWQWNSLSTSSTERMSWYNLFYTYEARSYRESCRSITTILFSPLTLTLCRVCSSDLLNRPCSKNPFLDSSDLFLCQFKSSNLYIYYVELRCQSPSSFWFSLKRKNVKRKGSFHFKVYRNLPGVIQKLLQWYNKCLQIDEYPYDNMSILSRYRVTIRASGQSL